MEHKVVIIGNVSRIDTKETEKGQLVTTFSVAATRRWCRRFDRKEMTETAWFRCVAWASLASLCEKKIRGGDLVYVEGRLIPDSKTGSPRVWLSQDGDHRANFDVRVICFHVLRRKERNAPTGDRWEGTVSDCQP